MSRVLQSLCLAFFLPSCSSPLVDAAATKGKDGTGASKDSSRLVQDATGLAVIWPENSDFVKSGRIAGQGGASLNVTAFAYPGNPNESYFSSCFDNNRNCRRAHPDVQEVVFNNPVVIQAFRLNLGFLDRSGEPGPSQFDQVNIDAASVTTAELQFNSATGAMVLGTPFTKELVTGATCDLTNPNAVGYANSSGQPKVLVGLLLLEEATKSTSIAQSYYDGVLSAARVWHSGIYPDGSSPDPSKPYRFRFIPNTEAASSDFGVNQFSETASADTRVSEKFGLTSSDGVSKWQNHVVIGWCLQGTKVKAGVSRPLLWGAYSYLSVPKLQKN